MTQTITLYNYKFSLLRNFGKTELKEYIKPKFLDYKQLYKTAYGSDPYIKISSILNAKVKKGYDDSEIDRDLFNALVYLSPERYYFLNMETELTADKAFSELNNSSKFTGYINRKLSHVVDEREKLISIRKDGSRIIFLFKLGISELGILKEKCGFYVPCVLDFENMHMEIRLNQYLLRNLNITTKIQLREIISYMEEFCNNQLPLALTISRIGESKIHKGLYLLFVDESNKSLKLIKREVAKNEEKGDTKVTEKELKENISKYLKEQLHVSNPEAFVEKVMSVKYQDTALNMKYKDFIEDGGYIFGFSFIDRKITKSKNRNEEHKPVYQSKIYWNLKDLIKDYEEISELAIYWKFNKKDFNKKLSGKVADKDETFAEIEIKELHNVLEIHYYVDHDDSDIQPASVKERRIREKYVIQKIRGFIQ
ncbi:hypothetical protein FZD47_18105 [Bacillus infantis]|uniref:Uncharacterized protein n=1 Tax=Bacillus infantis TaxID=324767 RepID=A0A5D4SIS0_9BACI|nr:hypothetical protein [Bacillus infantis]TYS62002.1 hypothetical protein FZD47_18105 [Bacillus infantis]